MKKNMPLYQCNCRYSHRTNRTLFSQKNLMLSKKNSSWYPVVNFFRVQNPENIQNGNGNRHTVQAVQERMQNGHGSGLSERMRNGNGNRGPSESEVVMVNGLRNAQKSPVASTSQGKYLLCFLVKFWFSDFTFIPFYFFTNFRHLQIILFIFYISRFRTPTFHFKPKFKAFKWK